MTVHHPSSSKRRWSWGVVLWAVPVMVWLGLALWFQRPEARALAVLLPLLAMGLILGVQRFGVRASWLTLGGVVVVIALWWASLEPRQDRVWAAPLAHGVQGEVSGSKVSLSHVRDFRWKTRDEATEHWVTKTVDLDQLNRVDFIRTVWASEHIAHTMISFGFSDGQYVVFSAEVRREEKESFSEVGGFFKQFELVLIGATEEDIVRLRTHARAEDVSIYPLDLPPETARALFLSYVDLGNHLAERPRFYQTITTNCTTVIWRLARHVQKGLPLDWRVLLSGHSQDYLYDIGAISNDRPLAQIKAEAPVTARARALPEGADYSAGLRAGLTP